LASFFSVVLVMVQLGLYFGFGRMVTAMIDHACAQFISRTVDWRVKSGSTATLISCAQRPVTHHAELFRDVADAPR
jgi:hypothetical protein